MIALVWESFGDAGLGLLFGLLLALVALLLVALGVRLGRRWPGRSDRTLVRALRELAAGRLEVDLEIDGNDPSAELGRAVEDLIRSLRERQRHHDHRARLLGDALETFPGRALMLLDKELRVHLAGESLARLVGGRPMDFDDQPASSLFTSESWASLLPLVTDREKMREGIVAEAVLLRAGGEPVPVRVQAADVLYPEEGLLFLLEQVSGEGAPGEDLSERLAAAEGLLDGIGDGIAVVREKRFVSVSSAARRWLGEGGDERGLEEILPAEDLLLALDRVSRAEKGEAVEPFRSWIISSRSGLPPRRMEIAPVPYRHEGRPAAALIFRAVEKDVVSPRRYMENQARLLAVLETVADGFVLLTPPPSGSAWWQVSLTNPRTASLLGLEEGFPLGASEQQLRAVMAPSFKDPLALTAFLDECREDPGARREAVLELAAPGGRSLELSARPVLGHEGQLIGRVLVLRDVTRHRLRERELTTSAEQLGRSRNSLQRAYEELSSVNRNLRRKAEELAKMNEELVELDRIRSQLLANVSHELQTPLVSIRGYTQMVLEGRLGRINEEQRRGLEVAVRNVDRMVEMISTLLAYARSESKDSVETEPTDPAPILEEVFERHRESAAAGGITLERKIEDDGLRLLAEKDGLLQVLDNLVGNAIKYNRSGGGVEVSVAPGPEGFATIEVRDTGIGIPEDEASKIFERFYRGRGAAGISGTGIGLATVRNLVHQHEGRITLESQPGKGSTFRILWPRASAGVRPS